MARKVCHIKLKANQMKHQNNTFEILEECSRQTNGVITHKEPIMNAALIMKHLFFFFSGQKIRLDRSCKSSAQQMIHMKWQSYFF